MRPGPASLALFFAALILYGSAFAQDEVPPGTIHELRRADLSGAPGMEVITSRIEYQPGQGVRLHSHHGVETGYVIQGAMIQMPGKEPTMLQTGATIWNLRDVPHGGYRVVGDTPLVLLTVHIVDKGKPVYEYVR
jgi:quercetin dioxygenase-like cupin family protein